MPQTPLPSNRALPSVKNSGSAHEVALKNTVGQIVIEFINFSKDDSVCGLYTSHNIFMFSQIIT